MIAYYVECPICGCWLESYSEPECERALRKHVEGCAARRDGEEGEPA